jgi:hypothetical protein
VVNPANRGALAFWQALGFVAVAADFADVVVLERAG